MTQIEEHVSSFLAEQRREVTSLMGSDFDNQRTRDRDRLPSPRDSRRREQRDRDRDRRREGRDGRDRYKDRDHRERSSERSSDRGSDRGSDRNREDRRDYRNRDDHRGGQDLGMPSATIVLRGLPPQIDQDDIRTELDVSNFSAKDVRLMKRKDTGVSRGFAFVEFHSIADAQRWMDTNQGRLTLLNQFHVSMHYEQPRVQGPENRPRDGRQDHHAIRTDWSCTKCGAHNFKRRDNCFKCNISREESDKAKEGDGFDQIGTNPCNTLLFRGLDALTGEDSILSVLSTLTALAVKNILVMRNPATQVSLGFAFVEMSSLSEASQMVEMLQHMSPGFEVDGKAVMVTYSKNTYSTILTQLQQHVAPQPAVLLPAMPTVAPGIELVQLTMTGPVPDPTFYQGADYQNYAAANAAGQYFDTTTGQYVDVDGTAANANYDYSTYYSQHPGTSTTASSPIPSTPGSKTATQTDATNSAAAVAHAAIQQAQAAKHFQKQQEQLQKQIVREMQQGSQMTPEQRLAHQAQQWSASGGDETPADTTTEDYAKYPPPDVSTYQYDETSGYYFDPITGLYYDSNSQYYYNSTTGKFMYWDAAKSTYLPAPDGAQDNADPNKDPTDNKNDEKDGSKKKEKVKMAKKIAKDMEKWAKTLNAQKEAQKDPFKSNFMPMVGGGGGRRPDVKESAAADAGFAVLEKKSFMDKYPSRREEQSLMPPPPLPGGDKSGKQALPSSNLVPSYGGDSDGEEDDGDDDTGRHLDLSKMACLLCKRQFPSREALNRHVSLSDLHKSNLEKLQGSPASLAQALMHKEQMYRDRAKERRDKYGQGHEPAPPSRKAVSVDRAPSTFEQPNNSGIQENNRGNKMLQKMGWSQGQGLGRKQQGRTDIIQAEQRSKGTGLGTKGQYIPQPGETYKDAVKKTMMMRFADMNDS